MSNRLGLTLIPFLVLVLLATTMLWGCMQHQGAVATGAESPVATMSGSNYYVATNGDDSNPGTESQPWRTIQKAADAMVAGDTVYVRGGTYSGFHLAESGTEGNLITFKAYPGEQPILDGGSLVGFTDYHGSSVVGYFAIDGFEIRNFAHGIDLGKSRNFVLRNNKVYNNSLTGITLDDCHNGEIHHNTVYENRSHSGIWVSGSTSIDIHHNVAYSNEQNGIGLTHGSDNNLIHHNTAYSNSCRSDQRYAGIGIEVGSENNKTYNNLIYRNCHAGYLTNSPNNEIYHNVIFGNTGAQISLGDWRGSLPTGNIIKNNILVVTDTSDNAIAFWRDATSYDALQNIFDHNLYYYVNGPDKSDMVVVWVSPYSRAYSFAQWRNNAGKEEHGLLNDPQFVDSNHNDFHLRPESPAIDAGANVGVDTDFDGKQRPQAGGFDIGAYEYLGVRLVAWARETTAYLSWTRHPNLDPAGYNIYYESETGGPANEGDSPIDVSNPDQVAFQLTGLTMYSLYEAWIEPYDGNADPLPESNHVIILPTDIFNYLPLTLRA